MEPVPVVARPPRQEGHVPPADVRRSLVTVEGAGHGRLAQIGRMYVDYTNLTVLIHRPSLPLP